MGSYATALYVLGLVERVADLADLAHDSVGQQLASAQLPHRITTK